MARKDSPAEAGPGLSVRRRPFPAPRGGEGGPRAGGAWRRAFGALWRRVDLRRAHALMRESRRCVPVAETVRHPRSGRRVQGLPRGSRIP